MNTRSQAAGYVCPVCEFDQAWAKVNLPQIELECKRCHWVWAVER